MAAKKKRAIYIFIVLGLILTIWVSGSSSSIAYPPAGSGYSGWTGEAFAPNCYWGYHVQLAYSAPYLYMVAEAPGAGVINLWRTSDLNSLNWSLVSSVDPGPSACDPYIDAYGSCIAVSYKKIIGSKWALVVKLSQDYGATWLPNAHVDSNVGWNNYEAHVTFMGDKLHCAYVSDYPSQGYNRNEVYYIRFGMGLGLEVSARCVSNNLDGTSASYPCIEATDMYHANVYYQHGNSSPHPIYESWTADGGSSFNITPDIMSTGGGTDFTFPECAVFWLGGDRRKIVVADGLNTGNGSHTIFYSRYYFGQWTDRGTPMQFLGNEPGYPQVAAKGEALLVVFRGSGSTTGAEGQARINLTAGDGNWSFIDDLFYNNMPAPNCAPMDCISDGNRFYTASCGRGDHVEVMTKREDTTNPTVSIANPGAYHNTDFTVTANASDDFNRNEAWFLSPVSEAYQSGITHADFYYRVSGGGWNDWPGGPTAWDAPFSKGFPGASIPEGTYDFRVVATDTAQRVSENIMTGIAIDRTPPSADLQISGADGTNGWYANQPSFGPVVAGSDTGSGIKRTFYKLDSAADWTVYSQPFALLEGEHTIHYYAEDNAGNVSAVRDFNYKGDFSDPSGSIVSPGNASYVTTSLTMGVDASDTISGMDHVEFFFEGNSFGSDEEAPYEKATNISGYGDGQKAIRAKVFDKAGRWAWVPQKMVKKDTTPPTVEITEPTGENWIRGMVTAKAATDDNMEVTRVDFYMDGQLFDSRTSYPWMGNLDTTAWSNDFHIISVKAYDGAGNASADGGKAQVKAFVGNNLSETNNFAEGCTRSGFDTWLCLQNPGNEQAQVSVNYMLGPGQGMAGARNYAVPAHSRMTVNVNADVGPDKDVSMQVTSSKPIVSERPMYFDYSGLGGHSWKGGHTAQGVEVIGKEWYLAEGCTRTGFEEWLCIQNPGDKVANVRIDYMLGDGRVIKKSYAISPWQRFTVSVNEDIGPDQDVSAEVTSDRDIVVERPMYFLYQGAWDGGHNVMAVPEPATAWYFAEGCTRAGFNEWLCLQNPGDQPAKLTVTYMTENGTEISKEAVIAPHSRHTINVNNDVPREHDISTKIISDNPVIAERSMYFWYGNGGFDEGSCAIGSNKACSTWYLAEGCTRRGFEEWLCLQNPGDETATVVLTYMLENGANPTQTVQVAPHSRLTVRVNDCVGPDHDVSTQVMSDRPIIVERPMYAMYRGVWGSADTLNAYTFEK